MTEAQLQHIEAELGINLPAAYRVTSLNFPFQPIGRDWIYWFYDTPEQVIGSTRYPHEDGEYDQANWKPSYVVFGQSAMGDLYFFDLAQAVSPVYCLSHEDYSITADWPTLAAYVEEWKTETDRLAAHAAAREQERLRVRWWQFWRR